MPKHAKLQQKNLIFSSSTSFCLIMKNQYNFWCCCYGNRYFGNVSYMILWTLWKKYVFGKSFRESLNPKGFVKNSPYLSIFTITGKDTMFRLGLSWDLYSLLCLWKLEIYRKTRKKRKNLANKFIFRQSRQLSIIKVLSQVSILVATESKLVPLQQEWPLTMEKIN